MTCPVQLLQPFSRHMGVNLGGGDGAVPEHFLDRADVGAIHQKFGGVAVTKGMRGHFFDDSGLAGVLTNDGLDTDGGEAAGLIIEDVSFSGVNKERFVIIVAQGDIDFN